jgi:SPP1 gp7 family putative phage head morphogenesis protein
MAVLREAADAAVAFMTLPPAVQARILGAIDVDAEAATFVARISGIGPLIADHLRSALNEGLRSGESIPKLADRVQGAFDVGDNRATTIARTEVVSASNRAGHEAAGALQDSGTQLEKVWLATEDARTRDDHADADGQTVGYDEPFVVGGEECDYPGDPSLSPEQSVNCRCTCIYQELSAEGDVVAADEAPPEEAA